MVVEEYDENGNPIQVISSEVVYTEDHMMGQHHGITSQQDHFTHATSSADPYSQYTEENSFEMQEYEEFVPPPQVSLAPHIYSLYTFTSSNTRI